MLEAYISKERVNKEVFRIHYYIKQYELWREHHESLKVLFCVSLVLNLTAVIFQKPTLVVSSYCTQYIYATNFNFYVLILINDDKPHGVC